MITNKINKLYSIFIVFVLISIVGFVSISSIQAKTVSDTITLSALEEHAVSFKLHEDDALYISGSIFSGTVDLAIYDSENYPDPYYYEEYWYDLYTTFTREFDAGWTDTFYVVFYNPSTTESASLTFTIESETTFMTNVIVNISLGIVFLGTILVVNFVGKKNNNTLQ
ncbi:MAG: hypothetical protein FK734_21635 [Asgard group archaeon]|nr:hypothetical protein [Asgard group archaeon]